MYKYYAILAYRENENIGTLLIFRHLPTLTMIFEACCFDDDVKCELCELETQSQLVDTNLFNDYLCTADYYLKSSVIRQHDLGSDLCIPADLRIAGKS